MLHTKKFLLQSKYWKYIQTKFKTSPFHSLLIHRFTRNPYFMAILKECYLCCFFIRNRSQLIILVNNLFCNGQICTAGTSRSFQFPQCHTLKIKFWFQLYNCWDGEAMPLTSQNLPQNNTGPTLQCSLASKFHFGESFHSFYLKYLKHKVLYSWFLKSRDLSEGYQTVLRNNISSEACNQELLMNITS